MKISVLTIFPQMLDSFRASPVTARAVSKGIVDFNTVDIKDFADGSFRKIDDSPCGGGPGMIMRVEPAVRAIRSCVPDDHDRTSRVVLLSPKGRTFNQKIAHEYASLQHLVLVCGHYEGSDARIEEYVDEQLSIGDFILTGGEPAAQIVCDSVIRLKKGTIRESSTEDESFEKGILEYGQYTHPVEFEGKKVPDVLLGGNQAEISRWRRISALKCTAENRPDLLENLEKKDGNIIGSTVYFYDDLVLKVSDSCEIAEREIAVSKWLKEGQKTQIKVPETVFDFEKDGKIHYCTNRIKGKLLCDKSILKNRNRLMKTVAAALKMIWETDITRCPFDSSVDGKLVLARCNVEECYFTDSKKTEGFSSPEQMYGWLVANKPEEDPVFSHGDLCLSNIFCNCDGITGIINWNNSGVCDRWWDITTALNSMKKFTEGPFDEDRFFEILGIQPDKEKIRYYTLLSGLL